MSILEKFLAEQRLMRDEDFAAFMGWNADTLKAKLARRETPVATRIKRVVLFSFDDVAEWLKAEGVSLENKGADAATADMLGAK